MDATIEMVVLGVVLAICLVLVVRHVKRQVLPSGTSDGCPGCSQADDCASKNKPNQAGRDPVRNAG